MPRILKVIYSHKELRVEVTEHACPRSLESRWAGDPSTWETHMGHRDEVGVTPGKEIYYEDLG